MSRCRWLDYAENRFRITYRIVEAVDRIEDIKHNVIRAALTDMGFDHPLNSPFFPICRAIPASAVPRRSRSASCG